LPPKSRAGANRIRLRTLAGRAIAACTATNAPRLEPISTTPSSGRESMVRNTCSIIRVTVRVEKSGSLRSGVTHSRPASRNFLAKNVALDERADDAKPWR
jgi:hypothetical protein